MYSCAILPTCCPYPQLTQYMILFRNTENVFLCCKIKLRKLFISFGEGGGGTSSHCKICRHIKHDFNQTQFQNSLHITLNRRMHIISFCNKENVVLNCKIKVCEIHHKSERRGKGWSNCNYSRHWFTILQLFYNFCKLNDIVCVRFIACWHAIELCDRSSSWSNHIRFQICVLGHYLSTKVHLHWLCELKF